MTLCKSDGILYIYIYLCVCMCVYICMYVCMYACLYVCMCVCMSRRNGEVGSLKVSDVFVYVICVTFS